MTFDGGFRGGGERFKITGYFVGALRNVGDGPGLTEWDREHLTRYHGWPAGLLEARAVKELDDEHHGSHVNNDVMPIPHEHPDFVTDAIEASTYSRHLKEALHAILDVVDDGERYATEDRR